MNKSFYYYYYYYSPSCHIILTQMINVGSTAAGDGRCKHDRGFGELLGPAVPLKAAPAQLPGADAAVPGLFSVKQPGLLAFKRALHALHHP